MYRVIYPFCDVTRVIFLRPQVNYASRKKKIPRFRRRFFFFFFCLRRMTPLFRAKIGTSQKKMKMSIKKNKIKKNRLTIPFSFILHDFSRQKNSLSSRNEVVYNETKLEFVVTPTLRHN